MTGEVSPLGRGDDAPAPGELRASREDRDRVAELLREAAGEGRLTMEELDQRLEKALTARTYAELAALSRDLPAARGLAPDVAAQPEDMVRIACTSGHAKRDGHWLVPQRIEARVTSGHIKLDFTEAVITQPSLRIDAEVRSGHLTLVTKPGIVVDPDDVTVQNGHIKVRAPRGREVPVVLRIQLSGQVGSGHITARPRRRTFWQWLLRHPPY
jgi:Domain of unknown function (DUF1707)